MYAYALFYIHKLRKTKLTDNQSNDEDLLRKMEETWQEIDVIDERIEQMCEQRAY